jgi:hypothetical protein
MKQQNDGRSYHLTLDLRAICSDLQRSRHISGKDAKVCSTEDS